MKTKILTIISGLLITSSILNAVVSAQYAVPEGLYHVNIKQSELNTINTLFPETTKLSSEFISPTVDPNLHFLQTGKMSVTFVGEGAGYMSKFGYFTYDNKGNVLTRGTIFNNASGSGYAGGMTTGGILKPGDTLDIGTFKAGTNVGFWLQANGFNDPKAYTYYSLDALNPDKIRHIAVVEADGHINYGFEDLYGGGDKDYNDLVFRVSATPSSAIDKTKIPGNPAPGTAATVIISSGVVGFILLRRRLTAKVV